MKASILNALSLPLNNSCEGLDYEQIPALGPMVTIFVNQLIVVMVSRISTLPMTIAPFAPEEAIPGHTRSAPPATAGLRKYR